MRDDDQIRFKRCLSDASNAFFSAVEAENDPDACEEQSKKALAALRKATQIVNALGCVRAQ